MKVGHTEQVLATQCHEVGSFVTEKQVISGSVHNFTGDEKKIHIFL